MTAEPERRASDTRLVLLERDMSEVLTTVKSIDEALKYPEQSPLGRSLTSRADQNHSDIVELQKSDATQDREIDDLKALVSELNGVAKAIRIVSLLMGLAVGLLTLSVLVRPG